MAKGRGREKEEKRPRKLFSNGPELKPKRSEEGKTIFHKIKANIWIHHMGAPQVHALALMGLFFPAL